jgi:hypothetical protein
MYNLSKVNNYLNNSLAFLHKNKYVNTVLILILVIYAVLIKPTLPSYLLPVVNNIGVRTVMITLCLYYLNNNLFISFGMAVVFLSAMSLVDTKEHMGLYTAGIVSEQLNYQQNRREEIAKQKANKANQDALTKAAEISLMVTEAVTKKKAEDEAAAQAEEKLREQARAQSQAREQAQVEARERALAQARTQGIINPYIQVKYKYNTK